MGCANMNFLCQGFRKLLSDRQTDRQTDTTEIIYHTTSRVVKYDNLCHDSSAHVTYCDSFIFLTITALLPILAEVDKGNTKIKLRSLALPIISTVNSESNLESLASPEYLFSVKSDCSRSRSSVRRAISRSFSDLSSSRCRCVSPWFSNRATTSCITLSQSLLCLQHGITQWYHKKMLKYLVPSFYFIVHYDSKIVVNDKRIVTNH